MRGKSWNNAVRQRAIELRKQDKSIGEIVKDVGVSKSTLFMWFKEKGLSAKLERFSTKDWMLKIQKLSCEARRRRRAVEASRLKLQIEDWLNSININIETRKLILSILYWAEGSKGDKNAIQFVNVDPKLSLLFITLFRECYTVIESKLRVQLHLHYYHRAGVVKRFWSELLDIPTSQFGKIYWKKRSKEKVFRKNFGGICTVRYNNARLKREIMEVAHSFSERITRKISNSALVA